MKRIGVIGRGYNDTQHYIKTHPLKGVKYVQLYNPDQTTGHNFDDVIELEHCIHNRYFNEIVRNIFMTNGKFYDQTDKRKWYAGELMRYSEELGLYDN